MFDYKLVDWKKYGDKTILDFWHCDYKIHPYSIEFTIIDFGCNGTDLNCEHDDILSGPFSIEFNRKLPHLDEITSADYNTDDELLLIINGEEYGVTSSNIGYFAGDFHATEGQAIESLLENIADYLNRHKNN